MKQLLSAFALFMLVVQVFSTPVPKHGKSEREKVLYDQRQEGDVNVRADLKNFVFLIIPTRSHEENGSSAGLFDLFRSHSRRHGSHWKPGLKQASPENNEIGAETKHFIESKAAPYHVDISKSDAHLLNDEILATQTPPVALGLKTTEENSKTNEGQHEKSTAALLRQLRSLRFSKAFVLTVPEEDFVLTKTEDEKKVVKKDGLKKKSIKKKNRDELTLLGAAEQCGPEMYRDVAGVCRLKKISNDSIERDE